MLSASYRPQGRFAHGLQHAGALRNCKPGRTSRSAPSPRRPRTNHHRRVRVSATASGCVHARLCPLRAVRHPRFSAMCCAAALRTVWAARIRSFIVCAPSGRNLKPHDCALDSVTFAGMLNIPIDPSGPPFFVWTKTDCRATSARAGAVQRTHYLGRISSLCPSAMEISESSLVDTFCARGRALDLKWGLTNRAQFIVVIFRALQADVAFPLHSGEAFAFHLARMGSYRDHRISTRTALATPTRSFVNICKFGVVLSLTHTPTPPNAASSIQLLPRSTEANSFNLRRSPAAHDLFLAHFTGVARRPTSAEMRSSRTIRLLVPTWLFAREHDLARPRRQK